MQVHLTALPSALRRAPEREGRPILAPFVVCSYDIEAYSATGDFPDATKEDDPVIQICSTFATVGAEAGDTDSVLLCLGDCADVPGADVECFDDEADMIKRWAELLRERYAIQHIMTPSHILLVCPRVSTTVPPKCPPCHARKASCGTLPAQCWGWTGRSQTRWPRKSWP